MALLTIHAADGTRQQLPIDGERLTVGRSRESDVFLPDQWLSRHHAEIRRRGDECFVADLGSKNGTLLNGERLEGERRLRPGDTITLGEHVLTYHDEDSDEDLPEPAGTQVYSARELSLVGSHPGGATPPPDQARQDRLLGILMRATNELLLDHQPLRELFEKILDQLFEAVPAERGAILLVDAGTAKPVIKASRTRQGEPITRVSRTIARRVLERLEALLLPNVMEDADLMGQDSIMATGIRSAVCAPLWFRHPEGGQDAVIGLVYLDARETTRSFNEDDLRIVTALSNVAAAKIEQVRLLEESLQKRALEQDMEVAAEIQRSLLPTGAPAVAGWELVGYNEPCRTVGGDYYDFETVDSGLLLALGDVSGKGTGAALLMTVLRAAVRAHWAEPVLHEAVERINRTVAQNIPRNKYITFFLARLDPAAGSLEFVNAGHNPPLLVRADGSLEKLETGGMVLGLFDDTTYEKGQVTLGPGDLLLVFSDGITETWNAAEDEFGEEGVVSVATRARGGSVEEVEAALARALEEFAAGAGATDDRTLIVLKRAGA